MDVRYGIRVQVFKRVYDEHGNYHESGENSVDVLVSDDEDALKIAFDMVRDYGFHLYKFIRFLRYER